MSTEELTQLVESNARSIQALTDAVISLTDESRQAQQRAEEERSELRQAMMGIANLVVSLDEDRPTVLRKLNSIETKVDRLLDQENPN